MGCWVGWDVWVGVWAHAQGQWHTLPSAACSDHAWQYEYREQARQQSEALLAATAVSGYFVDTCSGRGGCCAQSQPLAAPSAPLLPAQPSSHGHNIATPEVGVLHEWAAHSGGVAGGRIGAGSAAGSGTSSAAGSYAGCRAASGAECSAAGSGAGCNAASSAGGSTSSAAAAAAAAAASVVAVGQGAQAAALVKVPAEERDVCGCGWSSCA